MSSSFASLKKNSKSQFDKLVTEVQKLNAPTQGSQEDNRLWKPEVDKAGNGYAIIRFLPAPDGEDKPYVRIWDHGFQGPGGWYIEKSLTTLGQKDPVSEYNSILWNSGIEANKGKVMLYKYGKKIWDKIELAMNPEFEDEHKINPFDFWEGANFKLKIRNVEGYRNYDKSEFEPASALFNDDEELEALWKQEHSLEAFVAPKEFKSYDELKARLNKALGLDGNPAAARTTAAQATTPPWDDEPATAAAPVAKTMAPKPAPKKSLDEAFVEDDDNMDFFKKLAAEE